MTKTYDSYKDSGIAWIGNIPSEWNLQRLKTAYSLHGRIGWKGLRSDEFKENSYAYLVTGQDFCGDKIIWNKCYQIDRERYEEDPFIQLEDGDILVTKDGTIGKIAKVTNMDKPACLNSGIFVMRAFKDIHVQDYLYWLLVSPLLIAYNRYVNLGGTTIIHLYQNVFERMPLVVPSIQEQQSIASLLNEKCGEINSLISLQEEMITELQAYKQSVITEAVTKGLNPNVQMKDSGVKWIGGVPEKWNISRIGLHFNVILGKMLCTQKVNEDYTLEPYYCAANVHFSGIDGQLKKMWFSSKEKELYLVRVGDLLIVEGGAGAGGCAIVKDCDIPTYIQNSIMIVRPLKENDIRFLKYQLEQFVKRGYIDIVCNKATIPHFTKDKVSNVKIALPPLTEQQAIASYLDEKTSQIDALIAIKQEKITELKDYKKSIIYEYVTGKKRV